jgi:hypothetical protein
MVHSRIPEDARRQFFWLIERRNGFAQMQDTDNLVYLIFMHSTLL